MRNYLLLSKSLLQKIMLSGFIALGSSQVSAQENIHYHCTLDGAERVISVIYTLPGQAVPCEVQYTKEGQTETLWTYSNEMELCETQAASFAQKQTTWGWQCTANTDSEESTPDSAVQHE